MAITATNTKSPMTIRDRASRGILGQLLKTGPGIHPYSKPFRENPVKNARIAVLSRRFDPEALKQSRADQLGCLGVDVLPPTRWMLDG